MDYQDELKSVTVRVNNGSGVLVKPIVDNCFYILTAHHVVEGKAEDQIELDFQPNSPLCGKSVKVRRIISCKEQDATILIIDRNDEEITPFYPSEDRPNGASYWHTGYPNSQNSNGKADRCELHDFNTWLGSYDQSFIEYKYPNHIKKEELEGMSGGGVFDSLHHFIGVHKQLAADEEKEQLGKNVMIPWACFKHLLAENKLPLFSPDTFEILRTAIFCFDDNLGAKNKLKSFLFQIALHKADIVGLSPMECYDGFQKSRKAEGYRHGSDLFKDDWVRFGEFLVALKAVWGLDVNNGLEIVYPKFQYVQSPIDFDVYEAPKWLDPSLLGIVSDANVVFVVGGISRKGYKQDVKHKDVPDISVGLKPSGEFDIARTGKEALAGFTFVNANLFKDAMEAFTDEIRDCKGDKIEYYKNLILCKI